MGAVARRHGNRVTHHNVQRRGAQAQLVKGPRLGAAVDLGDKRDRITAWALNLHFGPCDRLAVNVDEAVEAAGR